MITISYLLSFLLIRLAVLLASSADNQFARAVKQGTADFKFYIGRNIILFGYHIHHYYFGILLISLAGWLAIRGTSLSREKLALIYGAGLGLFMDEIGLLLSDGDYFSSLSYLLGLFLLGVFLNVIFFPHFWEKVRSFTIQQISPTTSVINTVFRSTINILDIVSQGILKYKTLIIIIMIILLILDYLLPFTLRTVLF